MRTHKALFLFLLLFAGVSCFPKWQKKNDNDISAPFNPLPLVATIFNSMSIFGSLLIIGIYFFYIRPSRVDRSVVTRFVCANAIMDLFFSVAQIIQINVGPLSPAWLCPFAMFFFFFFLHMSSFCTGSIALILMMTFFRRKMENRMVIHGKKIQIGCLVVALIFSTAFAASPFTMQMFSFNPAYGTCWMRAAGTPLNVVWQLICLFIPLTTYILFCSIAFVAVSVRVRSRLKASLARGDARSRAVYRNVAILQIYPLLFVIVEGFNFAVEIDTFIHGSGNQVLLYLNVLTLALQGFLNALVFFGYNGQLRNALRYICLKKKPVAQVIFAEDDLDADASKRPSASASSSKALPAPPPSPKRTHAHAHTHAHAQQAHSIPPVDIPLHRNPLGDTELQEIALHALTDPRVHTHTHTHANGNANARSPEGLSAARPRSETEGICRLELDLDLAHSAGAKDVP